MYEIIFFPLNYMFVILADIYYCGAGEFVVPAHFTVGPKTQAEENNFRGRVVKVQKRPKNTAEDYLMLGTS